MVDALSLGAIVVFTIIIFLIVVFLLISFVQRKWFFPEYEPESLGEGSFQPWGVTQELTEDEVDQRQAVINESALCQN